MPPAGRALFALLLVAVVAGPLAVPVVGLLADPAAWRAWADSPRLLGLVGQSLALAAGAAAVAVPPGVVTAVLVERCRPFGGNLLRGLVAVGVFVPLAAYATGWQAAFAHAPAPDPAGGWRPWSVGLPAAVWVHAAAGFPWAVAAAAVVLRTTDRRLEDDARLGGGPREVVRRVIVPRLGAATVAAAACVAVPAWTQVTVTDTMVVRTFAEEVYTQYVTGGDGVPAAVALAVPAWAAAAAVGVMLARRFAAGVTTGDAGRPDPFPIPQPARVGVSLTLWVGVGVLIGVPLAALVGRASGGTFDPVALADAMRRVASAHGGALADSLVWSAAAGLIAASLAWWACVFAARSRWWATAVVALAAVAWVTPGPVLGFGLKGVINGLLTIEGAVGVDLEYPPLRSLLYDRPSPVPAAWAAVVRFFPVCVAVVLPAFRRVPRELSDLAQLDGGSRWERRYVVGPLTRGSFAWAVVVAGVLALGEVDAGKLVQPPGRQSFVQELFNAMHYGPDATVAALTLLQVAATGGVVLAGRAAWLRPTGA